jgi:serine/threonine-protein kinase RsbW
MLKITSCPSNIQQLEGFVQLLCNEYGIKKDLYPNILISLTEAVNNAIHHGNNLDMNKCVEITSMCRSHHLCVRVKDEGHGFDHNDVKDPTADENIFRIGGRGVFLIRELADEVHFLNNGNTVEMAFKI